MRATPVDSESTSAPGPLNAFSRQPILAYGPYLLLFFVRLDKLEISQSVSRWATRCTGCSSITILAFVLCFRSI